MNYYNEIDPYAAQTLRNLIDAGHIAPGIVDERSIEDVHPDELRGFTQCHFFAGVGVWSYALRRAGWPDERSVWTGSCPCQPFSAAGAGAGFDDKRHLWPHFHWLIQERRPAVVLGEQVASKDADSWIDLVQADLETLGYAVGAVPFPSAGVGAPHIRDRLYWVGHTSCPRLERHTRHDSTARWQGSPGPAAKTGVLDRLAYLHRNRCHQTGECGATTGCHGPFGDSTAGGLGNANGIAAGGNSRAVHSPLDRENGQHIAQHAGAPGTAGGAGPTNGYWGDADWLLCRDGKWRPVEPGTFPLAHGTAARVGRLRVYGNAINAEAAITFIESVIEAI